VQLAVVHGYMGSNNFAPAVTDELPAHMHTDWKINASTEEERAKENKREEKDVYKNKNEREMNEM
jgi:hypothetical protein